MIMNGLTIGSSASGANFGDASALFLFCANWPNTSLPILTGAGSVTTRGANPVADFNANKRLTKPNATALGFIGADTMGGTASTFLSGVPVTAGNTTTPGSIVGENLHPLITAELAAHAHGNTLTDPGHAHTYQIGVANNVIQSTNSFPALTSLTGTSTSSNTTGITINNVNAGSGSGHNTVERNMIVFWAQAL
jgi:hypothetical protein